MHACKPAWCAVKWVAVGRRAQVHLATLKGEKVVVKVQRPGLKSLFDIDLKNIRVLAQWLQKLDPQSDGAARDWVAIYDECSRILYQVPTPPFPPAPLARLPPGTSSLGWHQVLAGVWLDGGASWGSSRLTMQRWHCRWRTASAAVDADRRLHAGNRLQVGGAKCGALQVLLPHHWAALRAPPPPRVGGHSVHGRKGAAFTGAVRRTQQPQLKLGYPIGGCRKNFGGKAWVKVPKIDWEHTTSEVRHSSHGLWRISSAVPPHRAGRVALLAGLREASRGVAPLACPGADYGVLPGREDQQCCGAGRPGAPPSHPSQGRPPRWSALCVGESWRAAEFGGSSRTEGRGCGASHLCCGLLQGIDRKRLARLSVECYLEQVRGCMHPRLRCEEGALLHAW